MGAVAAVPDPAGVEDVGSELVAGRSGRSSSVPLLLIRHGEEQRVAVIRAELGHHPGGKREAAGKHKAGLERN